MSKLFFVPILAALLTYAPAFAQAYLPIAVVEASPNGATVPAALTPSPPPVAVALLDNHTATMTSIGWTFYGMVENRSQATVKGVAVTVVGYDVAGKEVIREMAYAPIYKLAPGNRSCVQVSTRLGVPAYRYEATVSYSPGEAGAALTTHSLAILKDSYGNPQVVGSLRNDTGEVLRSPLVAVALFSPEDKVVGCEKAYAIADDLAPGKESTFKVTFYGPIRKVGYMEALAEGWK